MSRAERGESGDAFDDLRQRIRGPVLGPADGGYDESRSVWNAMVDRRPGVIVQPTGAADVIRAVDYARENDLRLAVKGGGHHIAGYGVCDDGLVVDLSRMTAVHVDPEERTARVSGGATLGDVDHETQAFGLATPGGVVSTTGVGGLTLGGGFGWLSPKYGLAVDNLRSADVVTAAGELVRASETENQDLFWALRGGSGNFGVVTSFEFDLHPVGPTVLFGPVVYRYTDAADALGNYREFVRGAPRECCVWVDSLTAPPLPFIAEEYHGTPVLSVVMCYAGDPDEGRDVVAPLREYGDPIADAVGPTPYTAVQRTFDELYAAGMRNYWTSTNVTELTDGVVDAIVTLVERRPTPESDVLVHQVGGAINDVASDATAYPHRDARFVVSPGARWSDPADDDRCLAWIRDCREALAKESTGGTYVNFLAGDEKRGRVAYGDNYDRLREIKAEWDPENLFRTNQNVEPA
jgi:FAD/FMN-containing dehydrogenase